jgi:hypothetical protein
MAVDKKMNYEIQGGVKNYRPSKMVTVPKIAKSSPDTPTAKLAYITPEEEKILIDLNLYGSLKGKPNRGPGGIPSLEGDFGGPGGYGGYQGGGDYSSAETGNFSGFDGTPSGPELPPGVDRKPSQEALDLRSAAIAAGAGQRVNPGFFDSRDTISPAELAMAKAYRKNPNNLFANQAYKNTRGGGIMDFLTGGGFTGAIVRGIGQKFGLGKKYNEPTYDMSKYNQLGYYPDRVKGYTTPEGYEFLDNEEQAAIDLELFNKGMYTDDYKDMYGLGMDDDGGVTTIPTGDNNNNYTQNLIETINETVDNNIPDEDLLLRYLGADSTLNPKAAGVNSIAELRNLQMQRAKDIFKT